MMVCQGSTYFADKGALKGTLTTTLKEVVPTLFFGVPRVYEKIQEKMLEVGRANKGLKKQIGKYLYISCTYFLMSLFDLFQPRTTDAQ